jgi:small subunit ribosomal protein S9
MIFDDDAAEDSEETTDEAVEETADESVEEALDKVADETSGDEEAVAEEDAAEEAVAEEAVAEAVVEEDAAEAVVEEAVAEEDAAEAVVEEDAVEAVVEEDAVEEASSEESGDEAEEVSAEEVSADESSDEAAAASEETSESSEETVEGDAELTLGESSEEAEEPRIPRQPTLIRGKIDRHGVAIGTGRRKTSVARVRLVDGDGGMTINGRELDDYFQIERDRLLIEAPLKVTETYGSVNVWVRVNGGGLTGQAGAIVLGIARALQAKNPNLHEALSDGGYLTRDDRMVERKKYGYKKARKSFQFSKR